MLIAAVRVLPPLRDHLQQGPHAHPLAKLAETFSQPNHLRAFALVATMMLGGFAVIPYISVYLVGNLGIAETDLPVIYVTGGLLTLVGAPIVGRLADRHGKLPVYRVIATLSAILMILVTNLPRLPLAVVAAATGTLMLTNAGRMVAAMSMVTGSVEPSRRGGFMSANSAIQHISTGLGAYLGGLIIVDDKVDAYDPLFRQGGLDGRGVHADQPLAGRTRPGGRPVGTAAGRRPGLRERARRSALRRGDALSRVARRGANHRGTAMTDGFSPCRISGSAP